MKHSDYWIEFWKKHGELSLGKDEQTQVLRTLNKKPISPNQWNFTLASVEKHFKVEPQDKILDLGCGNGLFTKFFSPRCEHLTAVDISKELLDKLDTEKYPNVEPILSDIRNIDFAENRFSKVIIYAAIQYLTYQETVLLFEKIYKWLMPGGIFFIGDIPDYRKKWEFYNSEDRQKVYFDKIKRGEPLIGTWYDPEFFDKLGLYSGFSKWEFIPQESGLIYSGIRFDFKFVK